ncbi:hypothetical protein [Pseudomonas sp. NFIX28]|uniref:hypothetical protein n=1 Tax=Pseudomonas sp. NFIX28 TaxID=1566235 RepID=UPI000899B426|nr:hypothetical protein [Pseudomonas sp. NFIX28]SDY62923.1 hypothetical protein SAMN03159453_00996 [Pseudomonas sp. NFIX28]
MFNNKVICFFLYFLLSGSAVSSPDFESYIKKDVMSCDGVKVELVSHCLKDTVEISQAHGGLPVCTDQVININGKKNRRKIDKISQLTSSGENVESLSNVVVSMACLKGNKGGVVSIGGYGGCGSCPEWHGYYSKDGELVYYNFSNSYRSFGSSGSFDDLISQYGIKEKDLIDEGRFAQKVIYDNP